MSEPDLSDVLPEEVLRAPIEPYVGELGAPALPSFAISLCTVRYRDAGPLLRAALERAADGSLENAFGGRLFFRALHIIGGRRDPLGFKPLMKFLRRPPEEVEELLGDVVTETLSRIVAGVFDGDADSLFDAILDMQLDEFVRDALLGAATFLAWEKRIESQRLVGFLERFDSERPAPDGDMLWFGWVRAIGLLGLRHLEPAVMAAFDRNALPYRVMERQDFLDDLAQAGREPDDIARFRDAYLGYIEDTLAALEDYDLSDEVETPAVGARPRDWQLAPEPVVNPWRHVGRNDPCPCGSGKKAKRCCLAA